MFAEGGDDPMHSDLFGDGEFWDAWTTFYLREPGDGVLLGTRPRDEFLKLLSTRFNVDASVPCTCKANVPTPQSPDNIVLLRFEKEVTLRIQSVMPRSSAMHLWKLSDSTLRTLRTEVSNSHRALVKRGSALVDAEGEAEREAEEAERRRAISEAASREVPQPLRRTLHTPPSL